MPDSLPAPEAVSAGASVGFFTGRGAGRPTTGGGFCRRTTAEGFESWEFWWEHNRDAFLGSWAEHRAAESATTSAAVRQLIPLLDGDDDSLARAAALHLGSRGRAGEEPLAREALRHALAHEDPAVVECALMGLALLASEEALELVRHVAVLDPEGRALLASDPAAAAASRFAAEILEWLETGSSARDLLDRLDAARPPAEPRKSSRLLEPAPAFSAPKLFVIAAGLPGQGQPAPAAIIPTRTEIRGRRCGTLAVASPQENATLEFPLRHTDVRAEVSTDVATTVVRQTFRSPFDEPVEATYLFPLPTRAAVNDFLVEIGGRKILGILRPRKEAEQMYEEARRQGFTASLLTQERSNVFRQHLTNLEPGTDVEVTLTYFHRLPYRDGAFEYVFPMVVGRRYFPADAAPEDVAALATRHVAEAVRSGHDVSLCVDLDMGTAIGELEVPTHEVVIDRIHLGRARVTLAEHDSIPNRDFVLRIPVAASDLDTAVQAHREVGKDGYFKVLIVPPLHPADAQVVPREVTFVLDVSGSMSGRPLDLAREVIRGSLESLRPRDRFNILTFAGSSRRFAPLPVANTPDAVRRALGFLAEVRGHGGTEMLRGIEAYLETQATPEHLRMVCFLTDGHVGNEREILATIRERGQGARWFAFGVGSSVNRMLIEGIARDGGGVSHVVLTGEEGEADQAAAKFLRVIDAPVLVDVELEFEGLEVTEVYPRRVHDVFAGEPIEVVGRYAAPARGTLFIQGRVGARPVEIPVALDLPARESRHAVLDPLWARAKIADLSAGIRDAADAAALTPVITSLALEHRLMSDYTSFVAVDTARLIGPGNPPRIAQPTELPAGVESAAFVTDAPDRPR